MRIIETISSLKFMMLCRKKLEILLWGRAVARLLLKTWNVVEIKNHHIRLCLTANTGNLPSLTFTR